MTRTGLVAPGTPVVLVSGNTCVRQQPNSHPIKLSHAGQETEARPNATVFDATDVGLVCIQTPRDGVLGELVGLPDGSQRD
jgi:hypothetical protein